MIKTTIIERKEQHNREVQRLWNLKNAGCFKCALGYFDECTGLLCCANGWHKRYLNNNKKCEELEEV